VAGELGEQLARPVFGVGQWDVVQSLAVGASPTAWWSPLPTSKPRKTP
jgi:hypothetical protein